MLQRLGRRRWIGLGLGFGKELESLGGWFLEAEGFLGGGGRDGLIGWEEGLVGLRLAVEEEAAVFNRLRLGFFFLEEVLQRKERNMGMKLAGGFGGARGIGGGARGFGGGARGIGGGARSFRGVRGSGGSGRAGKLPYGTVTPLYGGSGGSKSHRSSAASQGSYSSLALVLAAATFGAAIL